MHHPLGDRCCVEPVVTECDRDADLLGEVQVGHGSGPEASSPEDEPAQDREVDEEHERVDERLRDRQESASARKCVAELPSR